MTQLHKLGSNGCPNKYPTREDAKMSKKSLSRRSSKELIIFKNCCLFHYGRYCLHVSVHPDAYSIMHMKPCFIHFLPLTLWLQYQLTEAENILWSFSKVDNKLFISLLGFHCITVPLTKTNKIIHVAQMSQCCLITNFPIKIKLGHLHWNIKAVMEEILTSV